MHAAARHTGHRVHLPQRPRRLGGKSNTTMSTRGRLEHESVYAYALVQSPVTITITMTAMDTSRCAYA